MLAHCRTIASFSDEPGAITRTFLSEASRSCQEYLSGWMNRLGMRVELDAIGNIGGFYPGADHGAKRLLIGSHLDTVPNAGAFDGVLGVVIGLMLVECLAGERLPFAIEVIGFSEEEGVRFGVPFLGSRALAGTLDEETLRKVDETGCSVRQAVHHFGLDAAELWRAALGADAGAYLEFHIEQGPLLETNQRALGVVTGIVGQSRVALTFRGEAAHAGTRPMSDRKDALCAAAEWITDVEREGRATEGLVATVGVIQAKPGVANVIPGEVSVTLDIRHLSDDVRRESVRRLLREAEDLAGTRCLHLDCKILNEESAVPMNETLTRTVQKAIEAVGVRPLSMTSGAGHDAMILAPKLPVAMVFLRSPGGISHHPDETVLEEDVTAALHAGARLLQDLGRCPFLI